MPTSRTPKPRVFRSLTVSLGIAFLLLNFGILFVVNTLSTYFNYRTQQSLIINQQNFIAREAANAVKGFIWEKISVLATAARLIDPAGIADGTTDRQSFGRLFGELSFRQLLALGLDGREIVKISRLPKFATGCLSDQVRAELLLGVMEGKEYISPVCIDGSTSEPMVIAAVPIKDVFGNFQGAFAAEINLKFMWDLVANLQIGEEGFAYVVDQKGNLIAFRDTSRVLRGENLNRLKEVSKFTEGFEKDVSLDIAEGIFGTRAATTYVSLGVPNWAVVVEVPIVEAYRPIIETVVSLTLASMLALAFAVIIETALAKRIARPLIKFRDAALQIAGGDLNKRVEIKSESEIGDLAAAFNTMIDKLAVSYADIRTAKEKSDTLLESIGDGVMAIDAGGTIVLWNRAEAVGRPFQSVLKLVREKDQSDGTGFIRTVLDTGKPRSMENHTLLVRRDGSRTPVNDTASPVFDSQGAIIGAIVVFRDVSHEYELDRAKMEFVSLVSHQLRTPLTAIKGYSGMLIDGDAGPISDQQKEYLAEIRHGNNRMIALVNALLNASRVDLGVFSVEPEPTNLREVAESVCKEISIESDAKHQHLETSFDEHLPVVDADPKLLRMIIQNLLSNAVKYTPPEGRITLTIYKEDPNILITVADTGYGIPKEAQPRIFEKLFRADNARQKDPDGNGLGLYIIKAVLEATGGSIRFVSEENKGTTFVVAIPASGMRRREGTKQIQ